MSKIEDPENDGPAAMGSLDEEEKVIRKGLIEEIRLLKNQQTAALSAVTKRRNEIGRQMETLDNLHLVKAGLDKFNEQVEAYRDCYEAHIAMLTNDEVLEEETRFEQKEKSILEYRIVVTEWIHQSERLLSDQLDGASGKTRLSRKSRSSRHSTQSSHAKEKARLAELLAEEELSSQVQEMHVKEMQLEMEALQMKKQLELEALEMKKQWEMEEMQRKMQVKRQAKEMQLKIDIAKAEARTTAYEEVRRIEGLQTATPQLILRKEIPSENKPTVPLPLPPHSLAPPPPPDVRRREKPRSATVLNNTIMDSIPVKGSSMVAGPARLDPRAEVFHTAIPPQSSTSIPLIQQQQTEILLQTQRQLHLPTPEVPKFKGDPIDYVSFIMSFDARILPNVSSAVNKLYYLEQLLEGESKDLVGGCMFMDPAFGYTEARRLLDVEYGDPFKVATAYVNKATAWPAVKHDDNIGLKQLSYFLTKCRNAMQGVSHLSVLNHAPNMQSIVMKLPAFMQNKWRDNVSRMRRQSKIVCFQDLVEFVIIAADSANDPVYSREALGQGSGKLKQTQQKPKQGTEGSI